MNLQFTEEHEMLRKVVKDFACKEVEPFVEKMEKGVFPTHLIKRMGELRLMGIPIPTKYGGAAMDFISYILVIHEISKVSPALGVILSVHTSVGTNPILYFGTEEQKQKYVSKLATGEYLGAFCLTEPNAGSDAANLKSRATKVADGYVINGSKIFITNGEVADVYIVFASTDTTKVDKGISAFIVEKNTKGLIFGKDERKMGLHGSRTVEIFFENMYVPKENLLGNEGEGFKIAMANLDVGRIGIAAQSLGIAEGAFEKALAYNQERKQLNQSKAIQQGISFKLADLATTIEASRLLVYQAAYLRDKQLPCGKEASMAKLFASRTAVDVAIEAVQIFGNYGYTEEYPIERFFRDAKITEIYEGTSEIQKIVISKHLMQ